MPFNGRPRATKGLVAPQPGYPTTHMRRVRAEDWSRRLVRENQLTVDDLIWPVFVHGGTEPLIPVETMPGTVRYSVDALGEAAKEAADLGIPVIAVFPQVDAVLKDGIGSYAVTDNNIVCQAVQAVKAAAPGIGVMCDAALDPFTDHGHDGLLENGAIQNDATFEVLVQQAIALSVQKGATESADAAEVAPETADETAADEPTANPPAAALGDAELPAGTPTESPAAVHADAEVAAEAAADESPAEPPDVAADAAAGTPAAALGDA